MPQSRDMLLASGVSEALVATATGLILGIIAMGFYSLFRNRVQSLISDLEIASAHVLGLIALNYNKKREAVARGGGRGVLVACSAMKFRTTRRRRMSSAFRSRRWWISCSCCSASSS